MRAIGILFGLSLVGAIGGALVMFIYQAYVLISRGVPRDKVPIEELLIDVMSLDSYAILGAAAGAGLAIVILVVGLGMRMFSSRSGRSKDGPAHDPDQIIRNQRAQVADEYLERRRAKAQS